MFINKVHNINERQIKPSYALKAYYPLLIIDTAPNKTSTHTTIATKLRQTRKTCRVNKIQIHLIWQQQMKS